jgi:hypothetical protein
MHDTKNLDGRLLDATDQEKRRTRNDKLTRTGNAAEMPDEWEAAETRRCVEDSCEHAGRGDRIPCRDEVAQRSKIV